ncbi:MAG: hypothetical protein HFF09_03380 [Oscillospiraceae bacterium]|nr:hypothetical protein [Oscillospiraceae bacterium]
MKKRVCALLCALVCVLGLLPARAGAAETVFFTAINDNLLPLTASSMPAWVDGVLYVPGTVLESGSGASNLHINCNYNPEKKICTLYTLNETLVFDLESNNSKNAHTGEMYYFRAIVRGGRVYVPIAFVCQFFGLSLSRIKTPYGELVRIKNNSVILSDSDFTDGAASLMETRLKRYQQSIAPPAPSTDDPPEPTQGEDDNHSGTRVYLAVQCPADGGSLSGILNVLDDYRYTALFLVRPGEIEALAPLLRRIVGSGHTVGLLLSGGGLEAQMARGNEALGKVACITTGLFAMESGSGASLSALGYVEYSANVDGNNSAGRVLSRISGRRQARVLWDAGTASPGSVSQLVRQLRQENYTIRPAVEPEF